MEHNNSLNQTNDINDLFGNVISSYSREQALEDGVLVDVSDTAREAGWRFHTAVTAALWADIQTIPARYSHEDTQGRLWDVLWMSSLSARKAKPGVSQFAFELILHREGIRKEHVQLLAHCGPGDNAEPVITIGYPSDF